MRQTIQIRSERNVANAVATAAKIATNIGFDNTRVSAISTAVSEIARNIVKYADFGQVTITSTDSPTPGIEITARDHGPGIEDIESALQDHFSTSGTLGLGLPGVKRLMDELTIESTPGSGTVVTARMALRQNNQRSMRGVGKGTSTVSTMDRLRANRGRKAKLSPRVGSESNGVKAGSYVRSHQTEAVSGDLVVLRWVGEDALIVVVDALGHGPAAARIAATAAEAVAGITEVDVAHTIEVIDAALRGSDGAAVAVAVAHSSDRSIDLASVGNVRLRVLGQGAVRIPWAEGTLGQQFRTPMIQNRVLGTDTLVIYSDGVSDRFRDEEYPGALLDPADMAAETIVRRFGKDYDDSSCAVVRFAR